MFSRTPPLGETLENRRKRRDGFYRGKSTESLVDSCRRRVAPHTLEDFAEFQPEWWSQSPQLPRLAGYELPPNGQGIAALSMLNIMETFLSRTTVINSAARCTWMIEAKKLAIGHVALRRRSGFGPVPVSEMLSKESRKRRAV